MPDKANARTVNNAEQAMLLRTWPRTKTVLGTVTTAGTPVTVDLSVLRGCTVFLKAVGGDVFGLTFQFGDADPVLVSGEDFTIADGTSEELYIWGDEDLRLHIDATVNGTKLIALSDTTP